LLFFFFFFSSRRRHTRFSRDWSSDVCSSDLGWRAARCWAADSLCGPLDAGAAAVGAGTVQHEFGAIELEAGRQRGAGGGGDVLEIGRASCRERGEVAVVAGSYETKGREQGSD